MNPRRIGFAGVAVTMAAAGWYFVVYLGRWEWNRALVAGVIFLAAEVGLLGALMLDRLSQLHRRVGELEAGQRAPSPPSRPSRPKTVDVRVLEHIQDAAPPPANPFAWLKETNDNMSVFVPVLLGAGVLLSGAAWLVERISRMTASSSLERGLAQRLEVLALPPGGLLGERVDDPFRPRGS